MTLSAAQGLLRCPHCAESLRAAAVGAVDRRRWLCPQGHSFDVAKQGYLNLAGAPEPANADTAAMLAARSRVQGSGIFGFLSSALDRLVPAKVATVLEVGAGTGHYLAGIVDARPQARGVAVDVSRAAAKLAARAHERVASVVADVWRGLPVPDRSFDVVMCVFAPRNVPEFARVLQPQGQLLVVTPTPEHLAALRARYGLLGIDADKGSKLRRAFESDFVLDRSHTATRQARLDASAVADLIAMGPNAFHEPVVPSTAERVELAVEVNVFRPRAGRANA